MSHFKHRFSLISQYWNITEALRGKTLRKHEKSCFSCQYDKTRYWTTDLNTLNAKLDTLMNHWLKANLEFYQSILVCFLNGIYTFLSDLHCTMCYDLSLLPQNSNRFNICAIKHVNTSTANGHYIKAPFLLPTAIWSNCCFVSANRVFHQGLMDDVQA